MMKFLFKLWLINILENYDLYSDFDFFQSPI